MAYEWQGPLRPNEKYPEEEIKNPEKQENIKIEEELSPEIIEMIMGKVQDIHEDGIAFSFIKADKFENVLSDGLLGSIKRPENVQSAEIKKKEWAKSTRRNKNSLVYINITGRMNDLEDEWEMETPILSSSWINWPRDEMGKDIIVFLFDIKNFSENNLIKDRFIENKLETKTYRAINKGNYFGTSAMGDARVDSDYGFALSHRVAPRFFNGIMIKFTPGEDERNVYFVEEGFDSRVKEYIIKMKDCYKNKQKNLLPIYDPEGSLYWPKQMSYEEVKKFVTEREAKKKEKESEDEK